MSKSKKDVRPFIDLTLEERMAEMEREDEFALGGLNLKDVYIVAEEGKVKLVPKSEGRPKIIYRGDDKARHSFDFDDYDCSVVEFFLYVDSTLVICAKCDPLDAHTELLEIREYAASTDSYYELHKPEAFKRIMAEECEAARRGMNP